MTDRTGDKPPTGRIFLTLQRGERLHCLALNPVFFLGVVTLAGLLLAASLARVALALMDETSRSALTDTEAPGPSLRISKLQTEVERLTRRNTVTSELLEKRVRELADKQAELESQALTLESFAPGATTMPRTHAQDEPGDPPPVRLKKLEGAMNLLSDRHADTLAMLVAQKRADVEKMEAAFRAAGLSLALQAPRNHLAAGGPFIPLADHFRDGRFRLALRDVEPAIARHGQLTALLAAAPLRSPVAGSYEIISSFDARLDPFHGRPAWHPGADLRSEHGSDILATAAGTVVHAGWNGAYGLMVEIDHGGGLATRYGHLSSIQARLGQHVDAAALIGRSGSTGRSTGAHLHYEVREAGAAVDPARYLRAGELIADLLAPRSRAREPAQIASR